MDVSTIFRYNSSGGSGIWPQGQGRGGRGDFVNGGVCPLPLDPLVNRSIIFVSLLFFYSIMTVTPPSHLRTAYCFILRLRTAYRLILVSRSAYRLTTKTTVLGVSIYIKKLKLQYVVCTCSVILENISF